MSPARGDGGPDGESPDEHASARALPEQVPDDAVRVPPRQPTWLYRRLSAMLLRIEARARARGARGTRLLARVVWSVVAAFGVLLLVGPVINEPLGFDDYLDAAGSAGETWIARSFEADYEVVRDRDGAAHVEVEERIQAVFPEEVDESGIDRVLASQYEGHDVRPTLVSAELDGQPIAAEVRERATRTVFAVDAGERLTGDHEVVLRYTLQDVAFDSFDESTRRWTQVFEWDAFGPDWRHGSAATTVRVTMPRDLVDGFAREPRGGVEWLLLSDDSALTPHRETPQAVTYELSNDQNLPPHSAFWFRFHFAPGTFDMPDPSILYWVMVVGPFVPLALAALTLLLALAARAVAWGDARGRAWYVAQSAPLGDIDAPLAARLWRAVGTAPLVRALADYQSHVRRPAPRAERRPSRLPWRRRAMRPTAPGVGAPQEVRRALARELHRAGRLGNWPHAWREYLGAAAWREAFSRRLRRVPRGFVRDNFIGAALALPILQLGLARQLSHQFPLSVYWWPVAVVGVAVLLGAAVLAIALTARPLTRPGAFARDHLRGMRLFVDRTSVADRGTLEDPLLPYAVMFSRPRRAAAIVRRAMDDAHVARDVSADPTFLSGGRLMLRLGSVLLVVGAFVLANAVPSPSVSPPYDAAWGDLRGSYGMFVRDFAADARLVESTAGRLVLEVEERLQVSVAEGTSAVPQVTRQWTDRPEGEDMGLVVTGVTIDGEPVEHRESRTQGMALMQTTVADEWPGQHEVTISYRIDDPVTTSRSGGAWHDEIRWTAVNPEWTFGWEGLLDLGGESVDVERVAVSLTVPADIAGAATDASALDHRAGGDVEVRPVDARQRDGGTVTYRVQPEPDDDSRYLGVRLTFPEGALQTPDRRGWQLWAAWRAAPVALAAVLGGLALAASLVGVLGGRFLRPGRLRDIARWLGPAAAAAGLPVFVWATADWSGDESGFAPLAVLWIAGAVAAMWSLIATRPRAGGEPRRAPRSRPARKA